MPKINVRGTGNRPKDSGYMLLVLMLAVAVLTITMLGVARDYRRGIQRDREVEMIHRGEQYERAVKRFYKKNNRYPTTLEQLEDTNKIRYLRKRYKDPMSPDGEWKLAHATDVTIAGASGLTPAGGTATGSGTTASPQSQSAFGNSSGSAFGNSGGNASGANQSTQSSGTGTSANGTSIDTGTGLNSATQGTGTATSSIGGTGATGTGNAANQVLGGGDVLGVVSKQKTQGFHSFGDKTKYNEWFFVYLPTLDTGKGLLTGPYNPKMFMGSVNSGLGNPNKSSSPGNVTGGPTNPGSSGTTPTTTTP